MGRKRGEGKDRGRLGMVGKEYGKMELRRNQRRRKKWVGEVEISEGREQQKQALLRPNKHIYPCFR